MLYYEIKKNFIVPNAFENWKEYREVLTKYIIQKVEEEEGTKIQEQIKSGKEKAEQEKDGKRRKPTLMILGAGLCNDFDLSLLVRHFSAIILMDYDEQSMRQAIEKYTLSDLDREKIEIRRESLNGIGEEEYFSFCEELKSFVKQRGREITHEEFEIYALNLFEHFLKESKRSGNYLRCLREKACDYICCFGLHSQLQAMFSYIYRAFEQNLRGLWENKDISSPNFMARLIAEDESFIPRFHDALFQCAKKRVFIGCEYARCQEVKMPEMKNREITIEQLQPIEGVYQAIRDIKRRELDKIEYTITWPFAPQYGICYNMLIEEVRVHKKDNIDK